MAIRVDVIFDVPDPSPYFGPTVDAVHHGVAAIGVDADVRVVRTDAIDSQYFDELPDAVVIGPGTPYLAPHAAELVITTARERGLPLVGT